MIQLICTTKEFNAFLGPLIRNKVQSLTKSYKKKLNGKCQSDCCKSQDSQELQAAHLQGRSRLDVINATLQKYTTSSGEITIADLDKVIAEIINAHKPIELNFKFLCQTCHREYDKK